MPKHHRKPASAPTPTPVSQALFARLAGVERSTVSRACRSGGPLEAAFVAEEIDLGHGATLAFLAKHPFARDADGDPVVPDAWRNEVDLDLVLGEMVDINDAIARAFIARARGRVLEESEIDAT